MKNKEIIKNLKDIQKSISFAQLVDDYLKSHPLIKHTKSLTIQLIMQINNYNAEGDHK